MPNKEDFNRFAYNPTDIHIDRSLFNMDHSIKFSCNVGEVIPFDVIEVLPGDTWSIDTSKVVRLQPLVTPIMDEVILDVYYFFVPNRLVWNKWKEFCGENNSSPWAPSVAREIPNIVEPNGGWEVGTIADYMGIPPYTEANVSALPFRAYALICDQWFRSESVMNPVNVNVDSVQITGSNGSDQTTDIQKGGKPFIACKFFDFFTSALPSPQRGDPTKIFPNNSYAPVVSLSADAETELGVSHPFASGKSTSSIYGSFTPKLTYKSGNSYTDVTGAANVVVTSSALKISALSESPSISGSPYFSNIYAKLDASSFNVNDLRTAFAVQRYLEKSARYGGRYIEFIKGFFGVDSPDARLQRSEYLGGSRISLNINQVTQNSATEQGLTPLGNVAGMSVTGDVNSDVNFSSYEHGYIIGCSVLRYHHTYQQGINKLWLRKNFEEFYLPTFAFLGEEPIYIEELYNAGTGDSSYPSPSEYSSIVFGYQERWSSYRYLPNRVAGEMRSISPTSLDIWHLADNYASPPTLSPEWLREDKSMLDRCLAVTSEVSNQCICDFYLKCKVARPLPMYSVPGLIDHY